jgi:uncharacterized coiled-coil DUF342 family protein
MTIGEMGMSDRDAYADKMRAKLDEWNAEIDRLSAKVEGAQADAKLEYNRQIEAIKKQRDEARQHFNKLQSASDSAWEDLRKGTDAAWEKMTNALKDAASRFK